MKNCKKCEIDISERPKNSKYCKECAYENKKSNMKEISSKHYFENKERLKPIRKKWRDDNKDKEKEYNKERYATRDKERLSNYYNENKDEINKRRKEYRKTDEYKKWISEYRIKNVHKQRYRDSLKSVIRRLNRDKKDYTNNLLGYSDLEFKIHIENQFTSNMSWENRKSFEIDHIIPIVAFLDETPLSIVSALDNLKPMDPYDNIIKFTSIDYEYIHLYEKYIDYLNDEYKSQILDFLSK